MLIYRYLEICPFHRFIHLKEEINSKNYTYTFKLIPHYKDTPLSTVSVHVACQTLQYLLQSVVGMPENRFIISDIYNTKMHTIYKQISGV